MRCRKCKKEIAADNAFCPFCGAKQSVAQKTKSRGNGQGSVFQRPNKKWIAMITVSYASDEHGNIKRKTRSKSGFATKKEALEYLPILRMEPEKRKHKTFREIYDAWEPTHHAAHSTINCYRAAIKYFSPLYDEDFTEITIDDLQDCVDECPKGKRTQENMKTVCGLLYKYAIPRHLATLDLGHYIVVRNRESASKDALPEDAMQRIADNVGKVQGADYVLCQCYLGFRPSEFLALKIADYNRSERAFVGGAKTDAGKNRVVTVSPKIQPLIDRLTANKVTGTVFCSADGGKMSISAYRDMFYRVLNECGIANTITESDGIKRHKYTPHSCRHTFATMMKRVQGADKDKLELIGHTSGEMLRYYQAVSFDDLRKITDAL